MSRSQSGSSVNEKTEATPVPAADTKRKSWFSRRKQDEPADEKKDEGGSEASVEVPTEPLAPRLEPVGFREMFRCVHSIVLQVLSQC